MISSALPLPTNSAASGALRLQRDARDRLQAGGLGEQAEFLELGVEMGQAEVDADEDGGAVLAVESVQTSGTRTDQGKRGGARPPRRHAGQAAASSLSAAEKLTARPGTMVEMACL